MPAPFGAVLYDWRGTLFHDEDDAVIGTAALTELLLTRYVTDA
jgi:hypothetical protein